MASRPLPFFAAEDIWLLVEAFFVVVAVLKFSQRFLGSRKPVFEGSRAIEHSVQPYKYCGSHNVNPGQMYMNTMHRITISMYGIIPANIWLIVTCEGDTPFR